MTIVIDFHGVLHPTTVNSQLLSDNEFGPVEVRRIYLLEFMKNEALFILRTFSSPELIHPGRKTNSLSYLQQDHFHWCFANTQCIVSLGFHF